MNKAELIELLARERHVEHMVEKIAHQALSADLQDLCQLVYLALLEYEEAKLLDLWENSQMDYFLARIIMNQYRSSLSPYYMQIRKFQTRALDGYFDKIKDTIADED